MTETRRPVEIDERRYLRGSMLMVLGRGLGLAAGTIIQIILVRTLTPVDFGTLAWALALASGATAFITLGLGNVASRQFSIHESHGDWPKLLGTLAITAGTPIVLGSIVAITAFLAKPQVDMRFSPGEGGADILPLILLTAPLLALDSIVASLFTSFGETRAVFFRRYLMEPALRIGAIVTVYLIGGGLWDMAVALLAAAVVGMGVYSWLAISLLRRHGVLTARPDPPVRQMVRLLPMAMSISLSWVVYNSFPIVYLGVVGGSIPVAQLRTALIVANFAIQFKDAMAVMFVPRAVRLWLSGEPGAVAAVYWRTGLWAGVLSLPALMMGAAFPAQTLGTLFGSEYLGAAGLLVFTSLGMWFVALSGPSHGRLMVVGRDSLATAINIITGVAAGVGVLLLVPPFGAYGASAVMWMTPLIAMVLRLWAQRGTGVRLQHKAPLMAAVTGMVGSVAVVWGIGELLDPGFAGAVVISLVGSLIPALLVAPMLGIAEMAPKAANLPLVGRFL